jgi:ppGpp synthetase/RelA/SpoT-type nucleotidyltranferase
MELIELSDFLEAEFQEELKETLKAHNTFLLKVVECLEQLPNYRPEIFRRPLTFRQKELTSIYNNLRNWHIQKKDALIKIKSMNDLVGVRLTIATKDQFEEAENIIREALESVGVGQPRKSRGEKKIAKVDKSDNDSGYDAIHLIVGDQDLNCEIQIRTLTQDLWAVFSHYESYKYESSSLTKRELLNYSKLMDVADDYAQLVRKRKVNEAEDLHRYESKKNGKKGVTFEEFEDILTKASNNVPELKPFQWIKFDVLLLCNALKQIHTYQIYSLEDLNQVINDSESISVINQKMVVYGLSELSFFDAFKILCRCHHLSKSALDNKNFGPSKTDFIDTMIKVYKIEDEFQKLSLESTQSKTLSLLAEILPPSLYKFRELNDCINTNKLIRFEIDIKDIDKISDWANKLELAFSIGEKCFKPIPDKSLDNWQSLIQYCDEDEENAKRSVYFHPDLKICEIAKQYDADENALYFGLLLNYPKCCIEAYLKWQNGKEPVDPITIFTDLLPFNGQLNTYNSPNPFSRYFGAGLSSHFPCSISCDGTTRIAQNSLSNLHANFPKIAEDILQLENSFVIFHKERGICLWTNFNSINNIIHLDKQSFQGQRRLKQLFEKIDKIEISQCDLVLFSNLEPVSIFKTNECFIGAFSHSLSNS